MDRAMSFFGALGILIFVIGGLLVSNPIQYLGAAFILVFYVLGIIASSTDKTPIGRCDMEPPDWAISRNARLWRRIIRGGVLLALFLLLWRGC